jgi:hypothetical protein
LRRERSSRGRMSRHIPRGVLKGVRRLKGTRDGLAAGEGRAVATDELILVLGDGDGLAVIIEGVIQSRATGETGSGKDTGQGEGGGPAFAGGASEAFTRRGLEADFLGDEADLIDELLIGGGGRVKEVVGAGEASDAKGDDGDGADVVVELFRIGAGAGDGDEGVHAVFEVVDLGGEIEGRGTAGVLGIQAVLAGVLVAEGRAAAIGGHRRTSWKIFDRKTGQLGNPEKAGEIVNRNEKCVEKGE